MMTVRCFLLLTRWPATLAPATRGAPTVTSSPLPTISTWSKVTTSPGSPTSFSTFTTSLAATLYCLPPVLITAKFIHLPAHRPVLLLALCGGGTGHSARPACRPCGRPRTAVLDKIKTRTGRPVRAVGGLIRALTHGVKPNGPDSL